MLRSRYSLVLFVAVALAALTSPSSSSASLRRSLSDLVTNAAEALAADGATDGLSVAFAEFTDDTGHVDPLELDDELLVALHATGKCELIDRRNLEAIMSEQHCSYSCLIDPRRSKHLGEVAGADAFLFCDVVDCSEVHGAPDDYYTTGRLRLIDVATSSVLWQRTIQGHNESAITQLYTELDAPLPSQVGYAVSAEEALAKSLATDLQRELSGLGTPVIGVWSVDSSGCNDLDPDLLALFIQEELNRSTAFGTVDRSAVRRLLSEHDLVMDGITDPAEISRWSKLYSVDVLLFCTVRLAVGGGYELTTRADDVLTHKVRWAGKILASGDYPRAIPELPYVPEHEIISWIASSDLPDKREPGGWGLGVLGAAALGWLITSANDNPEDTEIFQISIGLTAIGLGGLVYDGVATGHNKEIDAEIERRREAMARDNESLREKNAAIRRENRTIEERNSRIRVANLLLRMLRNTERGTKRV